MVAEDAGSSEYASGSSAFNSTSSDDESQALVAKDAESMTDNSSNSYGNRMNGPEVNSYLRTFHTDNSLMCTGDISDSGDSSANEIDEYDQLMTDHRQLRAMFEKIMQQNQK